MVYGIIILAAAVFIAYMLNKSNVSEVKIEAPEKIEPVKEPAQEEKPVKAATKTKKPATLAAKKTKTK